MQTTANSQQQADNGQQRLPQTGNDQSAASWLELVSLGLAGMLGLAGLQKKHE
ncbi:MAG TPA: LPXTG cell wall anchor domain-containing protein [Candidatus Limosilactobacillus merdipullorum]|uniref:LPXTG cell wall anchor domain-containing protein n=1 Tax=Candidatus Limosilactobacillus merdipullorum TaxID=2838653 RepID=A0A9D1U3P0_9LACO|nr:LPXTG cell wall anchor domain-containing protein [Candidatus Limosilactobacillus merdipullorum]